MFSADSSMRPHHQAPHARLPFRCCDMNDIPTHRLRILVDHPVPLLATGLATALDQRGEFEVLTRRDPSVTESLVDVVVTDYEHGLSLARNSGGARGRSRIVIMTMFGREHDVKAALEAGVDSYLLLDCPIEELVAAVGALGRGARYISLPVAQKMADSLTREKLTAREIVVLRLVAVGECNKFIARELEITLGTVKTHLASIYNKLDCTSRTQAARIALQRGLIDTPMQSADGRAQ